MISPLARYNELLKAGEIAPDAGQANAARALDELYKIMTCHPERSEGSRAAVKRFFAPLRMTRKDVKGLYIHGGVGRGKSMLMDLFFDLVKNKIPARRQHFHEFMLETHDWLHTARQSGSEDDLLDKYAAQVAKNTRLICFDEFHVTDVADAMILSRLFASLFGRGVIMVATSNWPPDRLYEGGLQRARFLPFIELIKKKTHIVELDSGIDYREAGDAGAQTYFTPFDAAAQTQMDKLFAQYANGIAPEGDIITVKGRAIPLHAANNVARATFAQLCEQPHGAEDYLAIARRYHTLFIDHVPKMGYDRRNELKRFMALIDVLYDNRIRVFISAEAPPDKLYSGVDHAFEFERTISRLTEMQSSTYLNHDHP